MDMTHIILTCSALLAPEILTAIVDAESGGDPYLITTVTGHRIESASAPEAIARARALLARGEHFRAGLMGMASTGWADYGLDVESAFDPCSSIRAGEQAVMEGYLASRGLVARDDPPAAEAQDARAWAMPPALDGFANPTQP
jgi:type IV secretion system protein VirB1